MLTIGEETVTGKSHVPICPPIIRVREIRLRVSLPELYCRETVFPLLWTVLRSLFCRAFVLLSITEYDNREGILLEKVLHNLDMPIQEQQLRVDLSSDSEFVPEVGCLYLLSLSFVAERRQQSIDDKRQINCNGKSTFLHKWEKHCSPDWKQCFSPFKRALLFYFFPFFVQYHSHVCSVFLSNDYFVKFTFFFSCYRCFLDG